MKKLELTLENPAANLALDEALLETAEQNPGFPETLRLWEPESPMVVVGRSSSISQEVDEDYCRQHRVPVFRRSSGGATIITGPGCLMYCLLLSYEKRPELRMLDAAHEFVMHRMKHCLRDLNPNIEQQGICDLTLGDRKFSGNSLRCKRHFLIYHGTLLYDFGLDLAQRCLKNPPRQPDYRKQRDHSEFICNLRVDRQQLSETILDGWNANEPLVDWPRQLTTELIATRYSQDDWNRKRE